MNDDRQLRRFRVNLLGLMGGVLACGVASYWLTHPTFHAASLAFTTAITVLLFASVAAIYGRHRTFWVGFLIFGWAYLALAFAPGSRTDVRPYLITSHLLGDLANLFGLPEKQPTRNFAVVQVPMDSGLDYFFGSVHGEWFQRVGHSLAALAHGMVGGVLAVVMASRRHKPAVDTTRSQATSSSS